MALYWYPGEITRIAEFLRCDVLEIRNLCKKYEKTNKYLIFEVISNLGQDWVQITYGKNLGSKQAVHVHVSYLGVQEQNARPH